MRILLTNDDGIKAEGLQALRRELRKIEGVTLDVIAPDGNRSATARSITTRESLSIEEVEFDDGDIGYATSGTPVDCVRFGDVGLLGDKPDLIVSGINHGLNLGDEEFVIVLPPAQFLARYAFFTDPTYATTNLVFTRLNASRIGRGWVAIREDERAAEAMGVNTFGLKILAFAVGAFLAGLAGTIKAHVDTSVSPDQYIFLESAFLLAAGVLVGATILKLLPEKLREVNDYRLLMFGLLLVVMMRFRPEGLIASKRRQLEFHEDDEELSELLQAEHLQEAK